MESIEVKLNYAIVFVSDMKKSVAFYRDVIGLPLKFESSGWTEFITGDATLALHKSEMPKAGGTAEHVGTCRPGFSVPDLDEFHKRMVEKNVPCLQEPRLVFGAKVPQYADPDGLTISIGEGRFAS